MMSRDAIFKNFLFAVFFGVGMFAVFLAILSDEILNFYQLEINKQQTERSIEEIVQQDKQTEELITDIEENPEIVKHLAPLMIGAEPNEPNALRVHVRESELEDVRQVLDKTKKEDEEISKVPVWVERCVEPRTKKVLFFAGAGLILLAFTCFRTEKRCNDI